MMAVGTISQYQAGYDMAQVANSAALASSLGPPSPFQPITLPSSDTPAQQAQLIDVYDGTLLAGSLGPPSSLLTPPGGIYAGLGLGLHVNTTA